MCFVAQKILSNAKKQEKGILWAEEYIWGIHSFADNTFVVFHYKNFLSSRNFMINNDVNF